MLSLTAWGVALGALTAWLQRVFSIAWPPLWQNNIAVVPLLLATLLWVRTRDSKHVATRADVLCLMATAFLAGYAVCPALPRELHTTMPHRGQVTSSISRREGQNARLANRSVIEDAPQHWVRGTGVRCHTPMRQFTSPLSESFRITFPLERHSMRFSAESCTVTEQASPIWLWTSQVSHNVSSRLSQHLPQDMLPLINLLVLGRGAMSAEDEDAVRGSGTAHLVAVSGMHVAINCYLLIVVTAWLLSKWTWLAERWSVRRLVCAAGIPGALLYAAVAGGSPAAFRAALGASLGWVAFCAGRDFCPQKASTVASLLLISLNPELIFDVGFLLSILATNSLLELKSQNLKAHHNLNDSQSSSLSNLWTVTWRPFVATLPLIVWVFGRSSPFALVANLALVPLVGGALVPLGSLHALVGPIPLLGHASAALFSVAGRAYLHSASVFSENAAQVTGASEGTAGLVILWVWSLIFLRTNEVALRVWASVFAVTLTLTFGFAARPNHRTSRVTFLDIGQGDASIVELPDGHVLVIDTGPGTLTPAGTQRSRNVASGRSTALGAFLATRNISRIHDVLITHPHPDHYGGLIGLRVPWNRLIDNGQASGEQTHPLYRSLITNRNVVSPASIFSCERAVRYHGATARLLAPCPRYDSGLDENDNSIVLELSIHGTRILFSGDVEQRAEAQLEDRLRPVDVLKVPHHGSSTSSTAAFLERVQPSYAVVSSELSNRYGHPSASVIERLAQHGTVLRTDLCGSIEVTFSPLRVAPTHGAVCVWNNPTHSIRSNIP